MQPRTHASLTELVGTVVGTSAVAFAAVWLLWFVAGLFGIPAQGVTPSGTVVNFTWQVLLVMSAGLSAASAGVVRLCLWLNLSRLFFLMMGVGVGLAASVFALLRPAEIDIAPRLVQVGSYYILYLALIPVMARTLPS
ncbi:MAG: hypothetical protein EA428_13030 [Spirochaetaceae bacterium]|nr:MAG: hypothetical protein EA428_13030 [Spirochaetaceae bacterium]